MTGLDFVDFRKAFDVINHELLLIVLLRRNFHIFFSNRFSQKCEIQMQTKGNYHELRPT